MESKKTTLFKFFIKNKKRFIAYLCIIAAVLFGLSIFFSSGYPSGDDVEYHAASVTGMADHSVFDILTNKITGCTANDLGYGGGIFYPPFAHVTAALIYKAVKIFGFDVFFALKVFYFLILMFAGIFMYELIKLITKHEKAALFGSLFYVTFPYVLSDILIRGAMAESAIFVFMPLVLMSIYYMLHNIYKKFLLCFVIGCIGMIHSHLVLTMFFAVICGIGFLPRIKTFLKRKRMIYLCIGCIVTLLLSLPFLVPLLQNKMNADYYVFEPGFMSSSETVQEWRLPLDVLFSFNRPMRTVVGFMSILGLCITVYAIIRYRKIKTQDNLIFLLFAIIVSVLCTFCSTVLFSWAKMPSAFLMIQFPWRLCSFVAFSMAFLLGLSIPYLDSKMGGSKDLLYMVIGIACCFSVFRINNFLQPAQKMNQNSLTRNLVFDYLPTATPKSADFINMHVKTPVPNDEETIISNMSSNTPNMSFDVSNVPDAGTKIVLPRLYYLGYRLKAYYDDSAVEELPYNMSQDGFIEFDLGGDANIVVDYPGTTLQKVSYVISGIVLSGLLVVSILTWKSRWAIGAHKK